MNSQVLKCSGLRGRMLENSRERLAALDNRLAPHILLHAFRCRHPRPAALAPARRSGNRHLHSVLLAQRDRVFESVFPLRRHIRQAMRHHLRRLQCGVEILKARQSHAVHPVQVQLDAFLGDVAVHPVPPHAWAGALRRILKSALQRIGRGVLLRAANNRRHHYQTCSQSQHQPGHTSPFKSQALQARLNPTSGRLRAKSAACTCPVAPRSSSRICFARRIAGRSGSRR